MNTDESIGVGIMSPRSPKQSKKKSESSEDDRYKGLSEEERELRSKCADGTAYRLTGLRPVDEEKVSRFEHENTVNELKEKLEKADSKNKELKNDKDQLRKERDDALTKLKKADSKNEELEGKIEDRDRTIRTMESRAGDITRLSSREVASDPEKDAEIERLKKQIDEHETTIAAQRTDLDQKTAGLMDAASEVANLKTENSRLQHEVEELKSEIARLQSSKADEASAPAAVCGSVSRVSADAFESDLFIDGRYDVRLARDRSYMSFAPDVEGRAVCSGGRIVIPAMAEYVPFESARRYEAYGTDRTFFRIELQD